MIDQLKERAFIKLLERQAQPHVSISVPLTRPVDFDNSQLPAGSPMLYFCEHCGWISDIVTEEWFAGTPRTICTECQGMIDHGWLLGT